MLGCFQEQLAGMFKQNSIVPIKLTIWTIKLTISEHEMHIISSEY
uniref:Uncharacterized protein n=1 Tax=Arundo donax TaxID=35708 RepID=A0A0A9AJ83_ARUDO